MVVAGFHRLRAWCLMLALPLALAGCGGGGGSDSAAVPAAPASAAPRQPQATVVRDETPTTARLSVGPADYLPTADTEWVYDVFNANGELQGSHTETLRPLVGADALLSPTVLRHTAAGLVQTYSSDLPASVNQTIGDLLRLPSPFHAIGSTRLQWRSGSFGADLDGDGVHESFEFSYRQTVVGEEDVAVPGGTVRALHLRDVLSFTVVPSNRALASQTASNRWDVWLAPGLGFVRQQRHVVGYDGADLLPLTTYALRSIRIGGVDPLDRTAAQDQRVIPLVHRALVYDPLRRSYIASVPGAVPALGNRLASIDADTGQVRYSAAVGSDPGALALAADGASIYVALDGSSEVLRLALPGLAVLARTALPPHPVFGDAVVVSALAASPTEPGVVAVSLASPGSSSHAGVALLRDGEVMPQRTAWHTGSTRLVFGADGSSLYGINTASTEFGLRRMAVLADGLVQTQLVREALTRFNVEIIDRIGSTLVLGPRLYDADSLVLLRAVPGAQECRVLSADQLACRASSLPDDTTVLLADPATGLVTAQLALPFSSLGATGGLRLLAGPSGQLAVRYETGEPRKGDASHLLLLRHPALHGGSQAPGRRGAESAPPGRHGRPRPTQDARHHVRHPPVPPRLPRAQHRRRARLLR